VSTKATPEVIDMVLRLYPLTPVAEISKITGMSKQYVRNTASFYKVKQIGGQTILNIQGIKCKKCSDCGVTKELNKFSSSIRMKSKLKSSCKKCDLESHLFNELYKVNK
jgi:hypothetical protein